MPKIRAIIGLTKMPDGNVTPLLRGALKGLTENAAIYDQPPVDLPVFEAGIDSYDRAIAAALDGSRTATALKNKLRETAIEMYVKLAHYVQSACNNDMQTFLLSGFQPAPMTKAPPQALDQPKIAYVVQGPVTGQLKIKIVSVRKALSYELRRGLVPSAGATPASWIQEPIGSTKPLIIGDLTPGTIYTFQVRALGRLGLTNWSDPISRMVI